MSDSGSPVLPLEGGCQCGSVRYRITELPLSLYACHCKECQKQSSSGFGLSMPVRREALEFLGLEMKLWNRTSESGNNVRCYFCPNCGSRLLHESANDAAVVNIKAGSLNNAKWLSPVAHLWVRSAQTGTVFSPNAIQFQTQPSGFRPLREAWVAKYEKSGA